MVGIGWGSWMACYGGFLKLHCLLRLAFSETLKLAKVQSICRRSLHAQCLVLSCVQKFFFLVGVDVSHVSRVSLDGIGTHGLIHVL